MPFLFAFYTMLGSAIELRQAPFLWLHDLSSPDKLFIMPVVMVISTYLMQKMTPELGHGSEAAADDDPDDAADLSGS